MSADDPQLPAIETARDAEDIGWALHEVCHYDATWAPSVFSKEPSFTYHTGPEILREELKSMWEEYLSLDERRRIVAAYMVRRLSR